MDIGAIVFSIGSAASNPPNLGMDKNVLNYNDAVKGMGVNIAREDINAAIHAKTPPSTKVTDINTASIFFDLEVAAGSVYSATANIDIPYIQRAISLYISPNAGSSTFTAGDTLDYQIWTYDNTGTYSVCAATLQQVVSTTGDQMQINWGADMMANTLGGYKILRQINGGGFIDAVDVGIVNTYTDSGFTGGDLTITPTANDFVSNGTTWVFTPSGVNTSPTGGTYKSAASSTYGCYDNNNGNAYRIYHNVYANGPTTGEYVTDGTYGYISSSPTFHQDTTTFTSITPPPEHYGIQANGSNLNWNINIYERSVVDGRSYYSQVPYNLTTTDSNDGQYRYATIQMPYLIESAKILMSVDGGANTSLISTVTTQYVDAFNWQFVGDVVVTPVNIYKATGRFEQQGESEDDPSAIVIVGLNGFQSIQVVDAAGTQLSKIIFGTDGSVDFICSVLKVNGTPV
jgi:hypothetical protein